MVARLRGSLRAMFGFALAAGCCWQSSVAVAQFFPPREQPRQNQPTGQPQRDPRFAQQPPATGNPAQTGEQRPIRRVDEANPAQPPRAAAQLPDPFKLTQEQERYLDQVLTVWQQTTGNIKTFKSDFKRWEYDPVWAPEGKKDVALTESAGRVLYAKPDKGTFRVDEIKRIDWQSDKYQVDSNAVGEHWVCNGESIWEFNNKEKLVIERKLPPEMQGQAIAGGPLPFLFGVEAPKLKDRYYLKVITPQTVAEKEVWIEAQPRFHADAQNFKTALLILDRNTFHPFALRIYEPNGQKYSTYQFSDIKVNDPFEWFVRDFAEPRVPFGWKKKVEDIPPTSPERTAAEPPNRR